MSLSTWKKVNYELAFVADEDTAILLNVAKVPGKSEYMVLALEVKKPTSTDSVGMAQEFFASHAHEIVGNETYKTKTAARAAAAARGAAWLAARVAGRRAADPCPCGSIQ